MRKSLFIIIVSYNGMRWVEKCVESVQSYNTIVIDNFSTDGTPEFINQRFPHVQLIPLKENIGFGRANNIGIKAALDQNAEHVFLLNQDALIFPGTIEKLIEVSQINPDYGIISPVHLNGSGEKFEAGFQYYASKNLGNGILLDYLLSRPKKEIYDFHMVNAAAWLLPKSTLDIVGGFNPIFFLYGEDDNYCQRVKYHNLKIGVVPDCFIHHDSSNNNFKSIQQGSKKYYNEFEKITKLKFANVNSEDYNQYARFKRKILIKACKELLKFKFKNSLMEFKKRKLADKYRFEEIVYNDRNRKMSYLDIEDSFCSFKSIN